MKKHSVNLNIHYTAPKEVFDKVLTAYAEMPGYKGFVNGVPTWFGENGREGKHIDVSVEPGGLQFYICMPENEFDNWFFLLKNKLTKALGYEIGEPEDGFDFRYY